MRFLLFSCLLVSVSCASDYKALRPVAFEPTCLARVTPGSAETQWYRASVDVVGHHISGLLLVKDEIGHHRILFMNEAGIKFFDVDTGIDGFMVIYIMPALDKKAVVELLRQDFLLLTGRMYKRFAHDAFKNDSEYFMRRGLRPQKFMYLVADSSCSVLKRVEIGSSKKRLVTMTYPSSEEVLIQHHTFDMKIYLRKIDRE